MLNIPSKTSVCTCKWFVGQFKEYQLVVHTYFENVHVRKIPDNQNTIKFKLLTDWNIDNYPEFVFRSEKCFREFWPFERTVSCTLRTEEW